MTEQHEVVYLSYPLRQGDPWPPAIPPMSVEPIYTIPQDGASVFRISVANHSGTHADAPRHVIPDGLAIADFAAADFIFTRPVVIDLRLPDAGLVEEEHLAPHAGRIAGADLLLLRFGYSPVRAADPERYRYRCPGFSIPGAEYLRAAFPALRAVGMDVPSFACIEHLEATMASHNSVLGGPGRKFLIIEDMNLDLDLSRLEQVWLAPWIVSGIDSAPCAVLAFCRRG